MQNGLTLTAKPVRLPVKDVLPVSSDELGVLFENRGTKGKRLKSVRRIHHKMARLLAAGVGPVEVAAATGMSTSRVWLLKNDPSFQELVAHYEAEEEERWQEVRDQAEMVGVSAVEELQDRLESEPEKVPTGQLVRIAKLGLDYGGHKPAEKHEGMILSGTIEQLNRLKRERNEKVSIREGSDGGRVFDAEGFCEPAESTPVDDERDSVREASEKSVGDSESALD